MFIKICALALICSLSCLLLTHMGASFSFAARLASTVLIGGGLAILAEDAVVEIFSLAGEFEGVSEYVGCVMRAVGVALLSRLCSDVCRDCGEPTLAGGVELAAKLEILLLSLPLIRRIIDFAKEMINM